MKPPPEPSSNSPKPRLSLESATGVVPVNHSRLARVVRNQAVVRNQVLFSNLPVLGSGYQAWGFSSHLARAVLYPPPISWSGTYQYSKILLASFSNCLRFFWSGQLGAVFNRQEEHVKNILAQIKVFTFQVEKRIAGNRRCPRYD